MAMNAADGIMASLKWPLLGGLSAVAVLSCSDADWSRADKENAVHFIKAVTYSVQAIQINNASGPGVVSQAHIDQILRLNKAALAEAAMVRDDILDRVHPELRQHFREEWQRGLQLVNRNLQFGDVQAEVEGQRLLDKWGTWYMSNLRDIRIPK